MAHHCRTEKRYLWGTGRLQKQGLAWLGLFVFMITVLLVNSAAWAQQENTRQTTQSPYFYIPGGKEGVDELPLKNTDVDVRISGVIADVTIVQHYSNTGSQSIEAKYVFPSSTRAAVYAMNVRIGERLIEADIREKQQARAEYEAAREEGKTAALLEEHLPNVFQMNVANIMPGDDVRVELHYTELLVPQSANYQFVFPTVVGPRYNSPHTQDPRSQAAASATSLPYLHAGEPSSSGFHLKAVIVSPLGIKEVSSPSHELQVALAEHDQRASIDLGQSAQANNRDFILNYRLAGDQIESGVMLYQGENENFFLAMVQPPKAISSEMIPPRDYIFVVDISGSMGGFPLDTAKQVVKELMGTLRPNDTFNVLLFSGSSSTLAPQSVAATEENIQKALQMLSTYHGSGSTELIPALRHVYGLEKAPNLSRTVVIVTDGYVSVEKEAFDLVRQNLDKANVFAFGIGSSVNRYLIEGLARAGMGEPFVITNAAQAAEQAQVFQRMIASPVLTSVKAGFQGFDVYDVEPSHLPDVLGERPVIVFGKWRGEATGSIVIEGQSASGPYQQVLTVSGQASRDASALRYLWARSRIDGLMDKEHLGYGNSYKEQITELGLKYSLLTPYTSFVAVDHTVRNQGGESTSVTQPLPMPQGVSDLAVGSQENMRYQVAASPAMAMPLAPTSAMGSDRLATAAVAQSADERKEELAREAPSVVAEPVLPEPAVTTMTGTTTTVDTAASAQNQPAQETSVSERDSQTVVDKPVVVDEGGLPGWVLPLLLVVAASVLWAILGYVRRSRQHKG